MLTSSKRNVQREGQSSRSSGDGKSDSVSKFDGNRDPTAEAASANDGLSKNVDFGASALRAINIGAREKFPARQPASTLGREISVVLNAFEVLSLPSKQIYQYSVQVGTGAEKRGLIRKVWESRPVQAALGQGWIFDGNAIALSLADKPEIRINVDLDAEQGKKVHAGRSNTHRIIIKRVAIVPVNMLGPYLSGQTSPTKELLAVVTALDHIMRETPSRNLISIKRCFYDPAAVRSDLGGGVDYALGVYQSLRFSHHPAGARLAVNVDVANGTFWTSGSLSSAVLAITRMRNAADIGRKICARGSREFADLKRLRRVRVVAAHRQGFEDDYVIDRFLQENAVTKTIDLRDGKPPVSIQTYFQKTYNLRLQHPDWPVVQMANKKAILPLELLKIKPHQRYNFKLDEVQTAQMIKKAVTPPQQRWDAISKGVQTLGWDRDPYLKNFGLKINSTPITVKARLLQNPKLQFGGAGAGAQHDPRTSGRWDLKGKKFAEVNRVPLTSWGVCVMPSRFPVDKPSVEGFIRSFSAAYAAHGGRIAPTAKNPEIFYATGNQIDDMCKNTWTKTGNKFNARPQILVFILQNKDTVVYNTIKRTCECEIGVVSQCMQFAHVQKSQPQYISNVLMKFNAKLGGFTNRAVGPKTMKETGLFRAPTVIVGCDVSHSPPGLQGPSMAAMTVSINRSATRYAAACDTNGHRVEMVTDANIQKHLMPMLRFWSQNAGGGKFPTNLIYFRDGVSEGQFSQVIDQEVASMKAALRTVGAVDVKFVVIIGSKRHHVRFFPRKGDADRNSNPLPGTLVETGVTQPYENDFYLCSHVAIKGTARPVHYNVLMNEAGMSNDDLQTLIYEHSYQYIRATTPVSQFPAIYYAHIASNRAVSHDKGYNNPSPQQTKAESNTTIDFPPLTPMKVPNMNFEMWYI